MLRWLGDEVTARRWCSRTPSFYFCFNGGDWWTVAMTASVLFSGDFWAFTGCWASSWATTVQGRASCTPPPRPTLLLPPPALSRTNSSSEFSGSRCSASLKIYGAQGLRGMDLGVRWGNGCGVLRACSGAHFIHGEGQTSALARADLAGAHGGGGPTALNENGGA